MTAYNVIIGTRYNGQDLALLIDSQSGLDWKNYPIVISDTEKRSVDFDHVCNVLTGGDLSPSRVCELSPAEKRDPVIQKIDDQYVQALYELKRNIRMGICEDACKAQDLDRVFKKKIASQPNHTLIGFSLGLLFLGIGCVPGYIIGKQKNKAKVVGNAVEKLENQRESCAHRRKLLNIIDFSESTRIDAMKNILKLASEAALKNLQDMQAEGEYDQTDLNKLTIYNKVYGSLFPKESLTINGIKVLDFLNKINQPEGD